MKLIIVRHGQTEGNAKKRLQGQRINESLNAEGLREADYVLPQLARHNISTLYASPLRRAHQTAELFSKKLNLPITVRDELAERDFGTISGLTWDEIEKHGYTILRVVDKALTYDYRQFGGEDHYQVRSRVQKLLRDLSATHTNETVVCVTHGGIIRILYDELKLEQPEHTATASLHIFELGTGTGKATIDG